MIPNPLELPGPEFKTPGVHFKHFEGLLHFYVMVDPICLCPKTNVAHPSLPNSTWSPERSGVPFFES